MFGVIVLALACGEGSLERPFSAVPGTPPDLVQSIENQFIIYLNAAGCDIRPLKSAWDPPEDPRHTVTLVFGKNLKLKRGSRGEVVGGDRRGKAEKDLVNQCIDEAISTATGMTFPTVIEKGSMTLQFPLVPSRR